MSSTDNNGGKTGWPPGLLQDDSKRLSGWLSTRGCARALAQEAALEKMAENARELGLDYTVGLDPAVPGADRSVRAWFTIDEINAWAEKKLQENPHWAEDQP